MQQHAPTTLGMCIRVCISVIVERRGRRGEIFLSVIFPVYTHTILHHAYKKANVGFPELHHAYIEENNAYF